MSKGEKPADKKSGGEHPEKGAPKAPSAANHGGSAPSSSSSSKNVGAKVGCHASGCKDKDVRFNFCNEHFRQFKFGLITKLGEKVFDYERKLEHYQKSIRTGKVA